MKMLVLVSNDESKVDGILLGFSKIGVKGATVVDSVGMGDILGVKIPFLSYLYKLVRIQKPDNRTIFAVIHSDEILKQAIDMVKSRLQLKIPEPVLRL